MSAGQQGSSTQQSPTWTEPPWSGWIETTGDALLILEAARRGLIPRVTRRLVDSERKMITSGSVFVFDEDESGIKRWTDGFFWSPSRILGNFLLYRETDKRGSSRGKDGDNGDGIDKPESHSLSRPKSDPVHPNVDKHRERILVGSLTNSYKFKPDGLMKKTFSLTIGGVAQHLISYYKIEDVESGRLRPPSSLPELASLEISPEYLDKTHFRNPPKVELCADGVLRYRGEADDIDPPSPLLTGPLTGLPLLTEGHVTTEPNANKRNRRYEPYNVSSTVPSKRPRKIIKTLPASDSQQSVTQFPSQSPPSQEIVNSPIGNSSTTETQSQPQASPDQNGITPVVSPTASATPVSPPAPPAGSYPTYGMHPYYQMPGYIQPPPHVGMGVGVYPHQPAYSTVSPTQPMHHAPPAPYAYAGYAMPTLAPAPGSDPSQSQMSAQPPTNGHVQPQQQQLQQVPVQPPAPGYYPHHVPTLPHPTHPHTYYAPAPPPAPSAVHGAHPHATMQPTTHPGHPPPPPPPPQMYSPYPPPPPHPHAAPMWPHPHAHVPPSVQSSPTGSHPQGPQPPPPVQHPHSHPHPHYSVYPPPPQMQMQVQMPMQHPQYAYPHPHPSPHVPAPVTYSPTGPPGQPQQQLATQAQPQLPTQGQGQGQALQGGQQLQESAQGHSRHTEARVVDSAHQEKQNGVSVSANADGMEVGEGRGEVRSGRESE